MKRAARAIQTLLETLKLWSFLLVVNDWGGSEGEMREGDGYLVVGWAAQQNEVITWRHMTHSKHGPFRRLLTVTAPSID
ncbi:MAG: hypothetical protein OEM32_09695, partial [Acidimicrobiia bacterium]|nr:hypothetical protein [Acidimicrobiia bacterium]